MERPYIKEIQKIVVSSGLMCYFHMPLISTASMYNTHGNTHLSPPRAWLLEGRDSVCSCLCPRTGNGIIHSVCWGGACHLEGQGIRQAMENMPRYISTWNRYWCDLWIFLFLFRLSLLWEGWLCTDSPTCWWNSLSPGWFGFIAIRNYLVPLIKQVQEPEKQLQLREMGWPVWFIAVCVYYPLALCSWSQYPLLCWAKQSGETRSEVKHCSRSRK